MILQLDLKFVATLGSIPSILQNGQSVKMYNLGTIKTVA